MTDYGCKTILNPVRDPGRRTSAFGSVFGSFDTSAFRRRQRADSLGKENVTSYIHTAIFPTEDFTFTELCYVMVLATDKKKAEDHIFALQVCLYECVALVTPY